MDRRPPFVGVVLLVAAASSAAEVTATGPSQAGTLQGWDDVVLDGPRPPGSLELRLNLGGEGWDNLKQSPPAFNAPIRAAAARTEARLVVRPFPGPPLKMYVEGGQLRYDARPATTVLGAGLAFEGDHNVFQLSSRLERRRPSVDIGSGDLDHDALFLRARYAVRSKVVEAWAAADRVRQDFPVEADFRDGTVLAFQSGASLLKLSRRVVPEVSAGWSRSDFSGDALDFDQRRAQAVLRYTPVRALTLAGRFEYVLMDFRATQPNAFNFERQDRRRYVGAQVQVRMSRQATWTLTYDRLVSHSTRETLYLAADSLAVGLTLRLGSTTTPPRTAPPPGGSPPRPRAEAPAPKAAPRPTPSPEVLLALSGPELVPAVAPTGDEVVQVVDRPRGDLRRIETRRRGTETETTLESAGLTRYSTRQLTGPLRFVVDLVGVQPDQAFTVSTETDLVRAIRVAAFRPAPAPVARVVFDLKVPVEARVERDGSRLTVVLRAAARDHDAAPALAFQK
jgi:hypothetical protein